jgi:hypothetical protein
MSQQTFYFGNILHALFVRQRQPLVLHLKMYNRIIQYNVTRFRAFLTPKLLQKPQTLAHHYYSNRAPYLYDDLSD